MPRLLPLFFFFCFLGCSGSEKTIVATIPVEGTLKIDGKPFGPATISLNSKLEDIPSATGTVKEDGTFVLRTYQDGDGAAEGEFVAEVLADAMAGTTVPTVEPIPVTIKQGGSSPLKLDLDFKTIGKDPAAL